MRAPLSFLLALAAGVGVAGALATAPKGLLALAAAGVFLFATYLVWAQLPSPRPWLLLAVLALVSSFVPWAALLDDRRWIALNVALTALTVGAFVANVRGERRRLR